jgi:hypothetical protein
MRSTQRSRPLGLHCPYRQVTANTYEWTTADHMQKYLLLAISHSAVATLMLACRRSRPGMEHSSRGAAWPVAAGRQGAKRAEPGAAAVHMLFCTICLDPIACNGKHSDVNVYAALQQPNVCIADCTDAADRAGNTGNWRVTSALCCLTRRLAQRYSSMMCMQPAWPRASTTGYCFHAVT